MRASQELEDSYHAPPPTLKNCQVEVAPVQYFSRSQDKKIHTLYYKGGNFIRKIVILLYVYNIGTDMLQMNGQTYLKRLVG